MSVTINGRLILISDFITCLFLDICPLWVRLGRGRMVVGFTITSANQCLSPLKLWVWILLRQGVLDTTLCDQICQWRAAGLWFSLGTPVSSNNKTDPHDITEIYLKVALNTITYFSWKRGHPYPMETLFHFNIFFIITKKTLGK